jgi:hypothetical protein
VIPPTPAELIERFGPPDNFAELGMSNTDRAETVRDAVSRLAPEGAIETPDALADVVTDMICNLLHLLTMHGGDPEHVHHRGWEHFRNEVGVGYEPTEPSPSSLSLIATDEYEPFLQAQIEYIISRLGLTWGDAEQREHMVEFAARQLRHALLD